MRISVHRPKAVETTGFTPLSLAQIRGAHLRSVERNVDSIIPEAARFSRDFGRIPLYPPARASVQLKLKLSTPEDKSEQEADWVAHQVVPKSQPNGRPVGANGAAPGIVPPIVDEVTRSPGRSLDPPVRAFMEARFGYDFGRVRIHAEPAAAASAEAINADAYTVGNHVVFDRGRYDPASDRGRRLLAHELAHVTQQHSAASPVVARQPAQKPAPPPAGDQAASAVQDECSKSNLSALQLPRTNKNSGVGFFEVTVTGIRFLGAVSAKQAGKIKSNAKAVAAEIDKLNRLISEPASKLNIVIATEGGSEFRLLCNQPVLIIDPDEFTAETGAHETTHGVTSFLLQQSGASGAQSSVLRISWRR